MSVKMSSVGVTVPKGAIKLSLENEQRDITYLWNTALESYQRDSGEKLSIFTDLASVQNYGLKQKMIYEAWRHPGSKADILRGFFLKNLDLIKTGTQKIAEAAATAFPPALAISTALTFVLNVGISTFVNDLLIFVGLW